MRRLSLAIAAMLYASPTFAGPYECSEFEDISGMIKRPEPPICVGYLSDDEFATESCRREIEQFKFTTNNYVECLKVEAKQAIDEYNKVVNSYNLSVLR